MEAEVGQADLRGEESSGTRARGCSAWDLFKVRVRLDVGSPFLPSKRGLENKILSSVLEWLHAWIIPG